MLRTGGRRRAMPAALAEAGWIARTAALDSACTEAVFCRLMDFRRVAARCDKLARDDAPAVSLAAVVAFWC